jgi:hypothetical protein
MVCFHGPPALPASRSDAGGVRYGIEVVKEFTVDEPTAGAFYTAFALASKDHPIRDRSLKINVMT